MRESTSFAGEAPSSLIISVSTRPYCDCRFSSSGAEEPTRAPVTGSAWGRDYNEERSHSAIGNKVPIALIDRSVAHGPPLIEMAWKKPAARSKDGEQFNDTGTLLVGG